MIHPRRLLCFLTALLLVPFSLLRAQAAAEVQVTPAQLRLKVAQQERLFLSAYDADGNLLAEPVFTFALSKAGVVRVETDGTVVGGGPRLHAYRGPFRDRQGDGGRHGDGAAHAACTRAGSRAARRRPPRSCPDSLSLLRLETARASMSLVTLDGSGLGQVHVTWRSTAPAVATVNDVGEVTALQVGEAQIMATGPGGLTAAVNVQVRDDSLAVSPDRLLLPVAGTRCRPRVRARAGRADDHHWARLASSDSCDCPGEPRGGRTRCGTGRGVHAAAAGTASSAPCE